MRRSIVKIIALGLVATAGLIGCGGGGNSTAAISRAQFIKQADAICERADKVQEAGFIARSEEDSAAASTKAGQESMVVDVGLPPIKAEAEEISDLGAPEGDEGEIEAIVTGLEEALAKAEEDPLTMTRTNGPFVGVNRLAAQYGLKACSDLT